MRVCGLVGDYGFADFAGAAASPAFTGGGGGPVGAAVVAVAAPSTLTRSLTAYVPPSLISIMTIGLTASRCSLKVTVPVTPGNSLVAASASRMSVPLSDFDRLMASNMILAASYAVAASASGLAL